MSLLRERMIEDMTLAGLALGTRQAYTPGGAPAGCSATGVMAGRIASSRNAPERVRHCLTRMLPARRHFVNRHPTGIA
jgi:hypothetical protein